MRKDDLVSLALPIEAGLFLGNMHSTALYLLFTSYMPVTKDIHNSSFADDTAFPSVNENHQLASQKMQGHIKKLKKWLKLVWLTSGNRTAKFCCEKFQNQYMGYIYGVQPHRQISTISEATNQNYNSNSMVF